MKKRKKLRKIRNVDKTLIVNIPKVETFLGFPVKRGMKNQLWTWNTLETVNF